MNADTASPLRDYLSAFRRQAWVILLAVVASVVLASLFLRTQDSIYQASTSMVVGVRGTELTPPELGGPLLTQTVRSLITSDVVAQQVIDNLELDKTSSEFAKDLHVSILPQSSVVEVSYNSPDRELALRVVQEITGTFNNVVNDRLQVQSVPGAPTTVPAETEGEAPPPQDLPQLAPIVFVSVFDPPHASDDPISPQPVKTIGFAAALGLAVGSLLAVVREKLNGRIRGVRDAEAWFGLPVAAVVPKNVVQRPAYLLPPHATPPFSLPEPLRFLGANLMSVYAPKPGSLILVTAATPHERKSELAAGIAIALARAGENVVCVDADIDPQLARHLGFSADHLAPSSAGRGSPRAPVLPPTADAPGSAYTARLIEVPIDQRPPARQPLGRPVPGEPIPDARTLHSQADLDPHLPVERHGRLRLLTPMVLGRAPHALDENGLREQIDGLRGSVDYVVVDGAPLPSGHSFKLASDADHVVVVAKTHLSTRDGALRMRSLLDRLGTHDASVVLVDRRAPRRKR